MKNTQKNNNQQYWYVTEIYTCVLCGVEHKNRYRVYEKPIEPTFIRDTACSQHFI